MLKRQEGRNRFLGSGDAIQTVLFCFLELFRPKISLPLKFHYLGGYSWIPRVLKRGGVLRRDTPSTQIIDRNLEELLNLKWIDSSP